MTLAFSVQGWRGRGGGMGMGGMQMESMQMGGMKMEEMKMGNMQIEAIQMGGMGGGNRRFIGRNWFIPVNARLIT